MKSLTERTTNFNGSLGGARSYIGEINNKAYHYNVYDQTLHAFDGMNWTLIQSTVPSGNLGGWMTDMGSTSFFGGL
jgi:hypothetical protein